MTWDCSQGTDRLRGGISSAVIHRKEARHIVDTIHLEGDIATGAHHPSGDLRGHEAVDRSWGLMRRTAGSVVKVNDGAVGWRGRDASTADLTVHAHRIVNARGEGSARRRVEVEEVRDPGVRAVRSRVE